MRRGVAAGTATVLGAILFAGLSGCATRQQVAPATARLVPSPLAGRPFDVVAGESQLIVLVYRAGPLAALGHNHVISCRCLTGTIHVPRDPMRASLDLRFAVGQLTVDDPGLRAARHSADFPPDVTQSARRGTRHNMLGAALLNAAKFPEIALRSAGLRPSPDGKPADVVAQVLVQIEGEWHAVGVPLRYQIRGDEIVVTGAFPLKQTDLGLTPFSALGGGLQVSDGMQIRLRLVARLRRHS
ncbi:MAG TPA: YceI family protein [Steroidobacteraceae bacterium]|nr:YceI family protein [Steroidobacteraceae bacterium]